ncbi:hypothetical protein BD324DRAFT_654814 [Kockovaella imperatae]|uniref:RNI-like protein n=1 Tax=Kockovaella imperatae TaxID=4999 RepID=A0A1Y1UNG6_9TREE|nr:hypothetical protein BD324DRAFT_654814 [Kockovaella imperatae]ORX39593.1 hypothetical protein BD324DRAFT_654814 [Kockovaella imperatae]
MSAAEDETGEKVSGVISSSPDDIGSIPVMVDSEKPDQPDITSKVSDSERSDDNVAVKSKAEVPTAEDSKPPVDSQDPKEATGSQNAPAPAAAPAPTPSKRRPNPPTKGILKPPPPPAKPTLGNRLRDIVTVVGGGAKSLFDAPFDPESQNNANGPHTAGPSTVSSTSGQSVSASAVGGALNALSGRLGLGISRLVAGASGTPVASPAHSTSTSNDVTPVGSPGPSRSISLPDPRSSVDKGKRKDLKRATFLLPSLSITYPISSQGEPWSEKVLLERQSIESAHRSLLHSSTGAQYWTSQRLVALYESACKGREERPRVGIVRALEVFPSPPRPRTLHIILRPFDPTAPPLPHPAPYTLETPLNRHAAEALADVLSVECGLADMRLEAGALDGDDALKAILHALLVSGTLPTLSLAGNRKIKAAGWRLLGIFLKRAHALRYLDLSETNWDRKGVEYLSQALNAHRSAASQLPLETPDKAQRVLGMRERARSEPVNATILLDDAASLSESESVVAAEAASVYGSFMPPAPLLKSSGGYEGPSSLQTLRMDGCGFRGAVLEALAQGIRASDLRNVSLRRNKIGSLGAVALALMIRDYPDSAMSMSSFSPGLTASVSNSSLASFDQQLSPSPSPIPQSRQRRPPASPLKEEIALPPSPSLSHNNQVLQNQHLSNGKTTHAAKSALPVPNASSRDVNQSGVNTVPVEGKLSHAEFGGASMALQRSVRALDGVERIGRLLTLDLKGNEIRNGVGYIAQVLKRNRTLKVLNLSENRIEPAGLVALAESLKYNSTLETLDLSSNPCCGPTFEGISALRSAFTVNTSLKRLFLSDTGLANDGAIALAEFLPESKSLLHLDLSSNPMIEAAGVMALSVGLKSNTMIRCLDLSIAPDQTEVAELSQKILQICIRNTELAASRFEGRAELIWGPIKKSSLVHDIKRADDVRAETERIEQAVSPEGLAREYIYTLRHEKVIPVTKSTIVDLEKWYAAGKAASASGFTAWQPGQLPNEDFQPLVERGRALRDRLVEVIQVSSDEVLEDLLQLNDRLSNLVERSKGFKPPPRLLLPSQVVSPDRQSTLSPHRNRSTSGARRHMRISSLEISSPNFSIGDSDNDSDAEELDPETINSTPRPVSKFNARRGDAEAPVTPKTPEISGSTAGASATLVDLDETGGQESARSSEEVTSPVERVSRAWVEEEGEIFRKGTRLRVVEDEEENDVSGEDLRQEILDTPVARSPTRRVLSVEESERTSDDDQPKLADGDE